MPATPPSSPAPGVGLRTILVIEDDKDLRPVLVAGLEAMGFRALGAEDAKRGAELARTNLPDLILCDIDMPGMDGRTLLKQLRTDPELADRQFVLMTGNAACADPRSAMDIGADDFILKPFSISDLMACVTARLRRAEISRHLENRLIEQLRANLHATLPHEFFTPLAGIFGLTDILLEELDTLDRGEMRKILTDVQTASRRLHRTLRNYLTILEIDSRRRSPSPPLLDATLVVQAVAEGAMLAAKRHRRLPSLQAELPALGAVRLSPSHLGSVAEEIVDNALAASRKETPVAVSLSREDAKLVLTVTDHGRGMSPKQLQQLGVFQQHDRKTHEQQGLGLGLVLVRRILDRAGGELHIESEAGKGTTVRVCLPVAG